MKTFKILGIASSIRSRSNSEKLKKQLSTIKSREEFGHFFEMLCANRTASNTEACLAASMYGALQEGAELDLIKLKTHFSSGYPTTITKEKGLISAVEACDGMIIASPVYFGDRSSYTESFIKLLRERKLFKDKVVGVVSVGAKRHGGQETTNVYTLWEVLNEGALVCGNGPKTAQFGGTGWAGDLGAIREDDFGMDTSIGVGHRVAQIASILKKSNSSRLKKFRVSFWITKDMNGILRNDIQARIDYLRNKQSKRVEYKVIDLTDKKLKRCVACNVCPYYFKQPKYGLFMDKIQNDDMKTIYDALINTDAIIVAGYNPKDTSGMSDAYQVFMERTRQIRRDNFILTNIPVTAYSLEEIGQTCPFQMKVMTSYLRHNAIILPPITQYIANNSRQNNCNPKFEAFLDTSMRIGRGRKQAKFREVSYEAVGYMAKDLDKASSMRK